MADMRWDELPQQFRDRLREGRARNRLMQKMISERYRRIRHARRPPPLILRNGSKLDLPTLEYIRQVQRLTYVQAGLQGDCCRSGPSHRLVVHQAVRSKYERLRRELRAEAKRQPETAEMVDEILQDATKKITEASSRARQRGPSNRW